MARLWSPRGSTLLTTVMFGGLACLILGSILAGMSSTGRLVSRQTEYSRTQYVADAGAEKVYAALNYRLRASSSALDQAACNVIATNSVPSSADNSLFAGYRFVTSGGVSNKIDITVGTTALTTLTSGNYAGLYAFVTPYTITSRAHSYQRPVKLTNGVARVIQYQSIPIFQFAMFYDMDMDISPGKPMTVTGRVHVNGSGYFIPNTGIPLIFQDKVTTVGNVYNNPMAGDTQNTTWDVTTYNVTPVENVPSIKPPVGAGTAHDLIELPPPSGTDPIATERLYNKAGLRIKVTDAGITATDLANAPVALAAGIITTNKTFYDLREAKTVSVTELDINLLQTGGAVPANRIVYVADTRTKPLTAVRLVNGSTLPTSGLSIASQNPLYIKGDYNTVSKKPAAIFSDAVNILSSSWNDANGAAAMSSRVAVSTTVNAALFTGINATSVSGYDGGAENYPRFLEDWTSKTFTYVGSMCAMFRSESALGAYYLTSSPTWYAPPTRTWSFDTAFLNSLTLPPASPSVILVARQSWAALQ